MYFEPEDEHEIFLRKLKEHHERVVESANLKMKRFEDLLSSFPLYKKAVKEQISFENYEENCNLVSELDRLSNDMAVFVKNNYISSDEEKFFEPQEVMRKINNKIARINKFSKSLKRKIHKANNALLSE